jgi:pimeloyl-ACP methyl ester carboxylesterase
MDHLCRGVQGEEQFIQSNGIRMRLVSQGRGPLVLLCHGFPGLWCSWRRQIPALAAAGYRAVAVDMRGYGRSDRPLPATAYDNHSIVADLMGVLDGLGESRAVIVGHDFGAQAAWASALHAPDRLRGVVSLAVPYGVGFSRGDGDRKQEPSPPDSGTTAPSSQAGPRPSEIYAAIAKKHFIHLHYFQKIGLAEAELGAQPREFLKRIYWALSARGSLLDFRNFPAEGTGYLDVLAEPDAPLPWPWLSEEDLDYLVQEYMATGPQTAFVGGLNSYRAMDVNWERDPTYGRKPITVPAAFICGEADPVLRIITPRTLKSMPQRVPKLHSSTLVPQAGHFVQIERPEETNRALLSFLDSLR